MNNCLSMIALTWVKVVLVTAMVATAQDANPVAELDRLVESLIPLLRQPEDEIAGQAARLFEPAKVESLTAVVREIRHRTRGREPSDVMIQFRAAELIYDLEGRELVVGIKVSGKLPARITEITSAETSDSAASQPPMTWDNLGASMDRAAATGFTGAVLVSRNGEIVLNRGYGLANREQQIKNTSNTVFAIGSAPIDFTHAGIRWLVDRDKLVLDDPITRFFDAVPPDKQAITIRHLMTGRSGLPDFHELPMDKNPDHDWIDRDEAVRRIMNQALLFEPGTRRRHSHSAWGLLAAVIELTSGQTYQQFTRQHLFQPAGMVDTGFFGDPVPEQRIAVGYGSQKSSEPNSPPHWGQTSWLVMGSGGQVSTLSDMYRWEVAIRSGKILSPESTKAYLSQAGRGIAQDGDMFGFEFMHSRDPDQIFMIISNAVDTRADRKAFDRLGNRLHTLVGSKE